VAQPRCQKLGNSGGNAARFPIHDKLLSSAAVLSGSVLNEHSVAISSTAPALRRGLSIFNPFPRTHCTLAVRERMPYSAKKGAPPTAKKGASGTDKTRSNRPRNRAPNRTWMVNSVP
jgi:hypothetical protein